MPPGDQRAVYAADYLRVDQKITRQFGQTPIQIAQLKCFLFRRFEGITTIASSSERGDDRVIYAAGIVVAG